MGTRIRKIILLLMAILTVTCFIPVAVMAGENSSKSEELEQKANDNAETAADNMDNFSNNAMNNVVNGAKKEFAANSSGRAVAANVLRTFYKTYLAVKQTAAVIITVSIFIGTLIFVICRKNKKRRRFGLYGFVIAVPLIILAIVYGIGILNGIYLSTAGVASNTTPMYDSIVSRYQAFTATGGSWFVRLMDSFFITYKGIKSMVPVLILIFVTIGLFRIYLCKYDRNKRDVGLYGYCIGMPVALILVSIGVEVISKVFI